MRTYLRTVLLVLGALVGSGAGCGNPGGDLQVKHEGVQPAEGQTKNLEPRTIPLQSLYTTGEQDGPRQVYRGTNDPSGGHLTEIYREASGMGASNIFLVRGKDITEAIEATAAVCIGTRAADAPSRPSQSQSRECWAVAYLGVASSAPPWLFHSAQVSGNTIRVEYSKKQLMGGPGDIQQYFAWVPLGELAEGTYTLELFDGKNQEVVLMRRVHVTGK